jgi:hypothetical protein
MSTSSDLKKIKSNTAATANELREFLRQMRGKSPKEMLGAVATSDLGKSLVQAAAGVAAAILIFTIIPFTLGKVFAKDEPVAAAPAEIPTSPATPAQGSPAEPVLDPDAKKDPTLDALGIGDTKKSPLTINPLEGTGDDILKDLE